MFYGTTPVYDCPLYGLSGQHAAADRWTGALQAAQLRRALPKNGRQEGNGNYIWREMRRPKFPEAIMSSAEPASTCCSGPEAALKQKRRPVRGGVSSCV
jgi:hypothetical protein